MHNLRLIATTAVLSVAACDSEPDKHAAGASVADVAGAAQSKDARPKKIDIEVIPPKGGVTPEQFDLEGTATLVREDRVKNGKALEAQINKNPKNRVDVDADGKRDRLHVVEVREGDERTFEIRAVPSSTRRAKPADVAVTVATIEVVPAGQTARVTVRYAPVVIVEQPPVIVFEEPLVADTFCHWVLIVDRPIFVGVAHVVVHERRHHKHKKHKKRKKHKNR